MNRDIRSELTRMLSEEMSIAPERVHDDAGLIADLGFDSIAFTMGVVAIEERLGIVVSTEGLLGCRTFGDLVAIVEAAGIPA
ncbi:acyl carrier protein [Nocardia niigatensis]|uniref:acyl carrier protein n=1 Tax=Nocardia niigatensis TaxID=209249 RepID=UPI0002D95191|nr:acyl carrier protein [Nocardia niigatensis]